jgi:alkylation response protein AidB-like acyl-CoA dehydrogenase
MITTAVAEGEEAPDLFFVDMRGRPWDGSAGLTLRRAWDGHGMMATQSHAFRFDACAATRAGSREGFPRAAPVVGQLAPLMFTAVILGVLDEARASARAALAPKWRELRAFEQVAWTESANRMWLAEQAYEGALRAVESGRDGPLAAARAKLTVAELAESALATVSRVVGGSSYSKSQLLGQWAQDVRALGFLRPPWGYAYDQLMGLDLTALTASP